MTDRGFNPLLFKEVADKLRNQERLDPNKEEVMRTIIGRIYYAIHLYIRKKLQRRFPGQLDPKNLRIILKNRGISEHKYIRELLMDMSRRDIANKHYQLFEERIKADYYIHMKVTSADVKKSYELYEDLYKLVQNL